MAGVRQQSYSSLRIAAVVSMQGRRILPKLETQYVLTYIKNILDRIIKPGTWYHTYL